MICPNCQHTNTEQAKFCEECGIALGTGGTQVKEQRRTVTVVFCDLTDSTAFGETFDPERLRGLLADYFARMKDILERHGGVVEKFIGDAVMAVFGAPVMREDDAFRAVRAAVEMRDALRELELVGRIGVMTGEVVTGTEERLATGDAVNVAARLEAAALPGEALMGEPTFELVHEAVEVERVEPLVLKGKAQPVPAYRILAVGQIPDRRRDSRFVGREVEVELLREKWALVLADERSELVTIVGEAGVGKSRLVDEALASTEATIVRGRCPPYGEGITYWPVVEVLEQLRVTPPDEAAARTIKSLLGEAEALSSPEEIAWAFRKTLEHGAQERPLIVVFDDIQWGEETFRDLIEHVALLAGPVPLLLLCMARPELVERRPTWPVTLTLAPLVADAIEELIPDEISDELRARILQASGGNPLFIEEMLAFAAEKDGDVLVPPTLQGLLGARLDQLEPAERAVIELASVEGEIFHRGAVQALAGEHSQVTPHLAALVRKQLIRPGRPQVEGEDGFRFRHLLIRDAAYDALPKSARADLHQRLGAWLDENARRLVELDEIVGYHLEQAWRYRSELGMPDDPSLAAAVRESLTAGAQHASRRQDWVAAANLFERAAAFVPATEIDMALETALAEAMFWQGRSGERQARTEALVERAAMIGDPRHELCVTVHAAKLRASDGPDSWNAFCDLVEHALPQMEATGDPMALYIGYSAQCDIHWESGRLDDAIEALEMASAYAEKAGYRPTEIIGILAGLRFSGSTPVSEFLAWLDEIDEISANDQFVQAYRGWSLAKVGRFDEARAIIAEARARQAERGGGLLLANLIAFESVAVELLAGEPAAAVGYAREGCRLHEELGDETFLRSALAMLARALYDSGRVEEAEAVLERCEAFRSVPDTTWTMLMLQVRAKLLAGKGAGREAERLARQATVLGDRTDRIDAQGDAYMDLGEVLLLVGKPVDAAHAVEQALERYERKGNLVGAQDARTRLGEISDVARR